MNRIGNSSNRLQNVFQRFELHALGKWILLASLIGVFAGLGAIAFDYLGQVVARFALSEFTGYRPIDAAGERSRLPVQPALDARHVEVAVF